MSLLGDKLQRSWPALHGELDFGSIARVHAIAQKSLRLFEVERQFLGTNQSNLALSFQTCDWQFRQCPAYQNDIYRRWQALQYRAEEIIKRFAVSVLVVVEHDQAARLDLH